MLPLSSDDRRALLARARQAIVAAVADRQIANLSHPTGPLAECGCAFVTLRCSGHLRGCIGQTNRDTALGELVVECALGAAARDPRFPPMREDELPSLEIEISVLSPFEPIVPRAIVLGTHGLLVTRDGRRGLLLPQVAIEHHLSAERLLEEACCKAGLAPKAWRDPETQLFAFTADVFSERQFHEGIAREAGR